MEKFNWSKAIGFGSLIWVVMFSLVSFLVEFDWYNMTVSKFILVVAAGALSYSFASNIRMLSLSQSAGYGFSWMIVGVLLDIIISRQFAASIFSGWEYWASYALILLVPMIYSGLGESELVNISPAS